MDSGTDITVADMGLDEKPQEKKARTDTWTENPPWASLHGDAVGVVLRFLPTLDDRARLRSVCRQWRAASRGRGVAPPLPLLVLPRLRFSSLTPAGVVTTARHAWMPRELGAADAFPVGSSGDWIVAARQAAGGGCFCFMVHAFSHAVVQLPRLGNSGSDCSLRKVVLSASPSSEPNYTIAASMIHRDRTEIALWRPGMKAWRVYYHDLFAGHVDIALYEKKLYMLWRFTPCLFGFDLGEDDKGVTITSMKDCLVEKLLPNALAPTHEMSCNMAEWKGKLLFIIRYYVCSYRSKKNRLVKIEVFVMDLSKMPCGLTQIQSFDTDCVFVDVGGCGKSFPAGEHGGAGVEGDLIYFGPDHYNPNGAFAYSMRDGRSRPIVKPKPLPCVSIASRRNLGFPVWLFPSE